MDKSTVVFLIALGVVIGIPLGVLSVVLAVERERDRLKRRSWELGYQAACVNEGLGHLRRVK